MTGTAFAILAMFFLYRHNLWLNSNKTDNKYVIMFNIFSLTVPLYKLVYNRKWPQNGVVTILKVRNKMIEQRSLKI